MKPSERRAMEAEKRAMREAADRERELAEMMKEDKDKKKEKKDSAKVEKKGEKLKLDFDDRKDRVMKLTRFSGRLGDHYLTRDGKKLFYVTRLEKSSDLCMLDLEDNSVKVVSKGEPSLTARPFWQNIS